MIEETADVLEIVVAGHTFVVEKNRVGELSKMILKCLVPGLAEAWAIFERYGLHSINFFCFVSKTPLYIMQVTALVTQHDIRYARFLLPYEKVKLNIKHELMITHDDWLRPLYAMYREGKNSSSVFYSFLCYYKVLEGVFTSFMEKLRIFMENEYDSVLSFKPLVPDGETVPPDLKSYIGKNIKAVFDKELTKKYRDAVAHLRIKIDDRVLDPSSLAYIARYAAISRFTETCCIVCVRMLGDELYRHRIKKENLPP